MDNETPQVTLAVAGSDATLTANSGSSSTDKKIILKTPSLSDSKHRDHKKARSNSVASKDLDAAPDSTGIIPNDACAGFDVLPKKRGSSSTSKGSSTKQRRRRRLRAVQGFKPCPQEILNGTSWKTRLADYFAIVSHDAKDGDHHHHSTIFPASAPSAVMPPVVTSMVPHEDYKDTKLPSDLGVFCFPDGITTVLASTKPSPLFHCFSLTNEVGIRLYVFCLRVFKPSDLSIGSAEGFHDYTPVALCIVSHHPFVSLFKAYLCGAYAIMSAPEKASCSVEAYISSILFRVPMPIPGVSEVVCSIDASHSMSVSLPLKTQFPFVDVNKNILLLCAKAFVSLWFFLVSSAYDV